MTNEERIKGLEDAVILLSKIDQARLGPYAADRCAGVPVYGSQINDWIRSVQEHQAGT